MAKKRNEIVVEEEDSRRSRPQGEETPKRSGKGKKRKKRKSPVQKVLRVLVILLIVFILYAAGMLTYLSATEYKPEDIENVAVEGEAKPNEITGRTTVSAGDTVNVMSWNIGYGALGDNADFFLDGGKSVKSSDEARVRENLEEISKSIETVHPNVVFLQEVDRKSTRSYEIDEASTIKSYLNEKAGLNYLSTFATNYKVNFIPYPIPPIGKVDAGIMTLSDYEVSSSTRMQLPCPFSWPMRLINLKRCLMVDRVPVVDESGNPTGKELVLVNLHLEAYDSGEGKAEQTKMLKDFLQQEVDKGNYVIAGGDFNQKFSTVDSRIYPEYDGSWHCGDIDVSEFGDDFEFIMDNSTPSCRYLDMVYEGADKMTFQYYLIDGFIVSKNLDVNYYFTIGQDFKNSDHNPVVLSVNLK